MHRELRFRWHRDVPEKWRKAKTTLSLVDSEKSQGWVLQSFRNNNIPFRSRFRPSRFLSGSCARMRRHRHGNFDSTTLARHFMGPAQPLCSIWASAVALVCGPCTSGLDRAHGSRESHHLGRALPPGKAPSGAARDRGRRSENLRRPACAKSTGAAGTISAPFFPTCIRRVNGRWSAPTAPAAPSQAPAAKGSAGIKYLGPSSSEDARPGTVCGVGI